MTDKLNKINAFTQTITTAKSVIYSINSNIILQTMKNFEQ